MINLKDGNIYEITGLNYYGCHFGATFEHSYYAKEYLNNKKALSSVLALTLRVNGEVVERYESRGSKLVRVI